MAELSRYLKEEFSISQFPNNNASCFFCDEEIKKGGFWVANHAIAVCDGCQGKLIDLLIDTLNDTIQFNLLSQEEQVDYLTSLYMQRILKKRAIQKHIHRINENKRRKDNE